MFPAKVHRFFFLFGLISLAFGMMMGTVPTSVPQFILLGNWILEGKYLSKWHMLKRNKLFWILSSAFLIHVIGIIYSGDLGAAIADLKTKMPLMFLPLIFFSAAPLSKKEYDAFLYFFIAGSVVNTLWCLCYSFVLHQNEVVRNASRFMSHIRLGLYLNMAIASCVYFIYHSRSLLVKLLFSLLILYFVYVLYALGLATGILNFMILGTLCVFIFIYYQKPLIKLAAAFLLFILAAGVINYVASIKDTQLTLKAHENNHPKRNAPSGRPYWHSESGKQMENGYYIQMNIQPVELQQEWKRRFPADSFNYDAKHNLVRYEVLLRYLSSKGLCKDSMALSSLTETDCENIKKGIVNYQFKDWSFLHKRVYEFVNEYSEFKNNSYVNGRSSTMRLYFWKAAWLTIKKSVLFGVGTGDVQVELNKTYIESHSPLSEEWYKRPHNQYLTITVALGITGLLVFLISIFYPLVLYRKELPVLFWPFILLALGSFFMEDTLETQAGLTFYAVFNTLFLSMVYYKNHSYTKVTEVH